MSETQLLLLLLLILLSGLFSGAETALVSLTLVKVNSLAERGKRGSAALLRLKQNPHKMIITILIGNNLVNISAASLATVTFTGMFGSKGVGIATGIMTFLILLFGEIVPKTFATQNAERISLILARPLELLSFALSPAIQLFESISRFVSNLADSKEEVQLSEEEVKMIVTMGYEEGLISKQAATIMQNLLESETMKVAKIMIPQVSMAVINGEEKIKNILDFVVKKAYSRYPVFEDHEDHIIGVLDIDDVLKCVKNNKLNTIVKNLVRPAIFVPQTAQINLLLSQLKKEKTSLAITVDEYGNVAGMITLEDILEELVGDIFAKSNNKEAHIHHINKQLTTVDARTSIEEINKTFHLNLPQEHFNTIAGFVESKLQKIPKKGEQIQLKKVIIEVKEADSQGIKSLKIIKD